MITLNDLSQASPSYARLLSELKKTYTDLEFDQLKNKLKSYIEGELSNADIKKIQKVCKKLGIDISDNTVEDIERIYGHWQTFNAPISEFTEMKQWSIDWDTSTVAGGSEEIELKLAVKADTHVEVWNKSRASQESYLIPESDVLINHEVTAGYSANGKGAFTSGYATASIGIDHAREIEFDRFFQFPATTPTYRVLSKGFSNDLAIWDIEQVFNALSPCSDKTNCIGLRELTLNTLGKFAVTGSIGLGRAWAKQGKGKLSDVSSALNLKVGLSKSFEHNGNIKIRLSKQTPTQNNHNLSILKAEVALSEANKDSLSFSLNANAEIKGLDILAKKYIMPLFDDADELVAKLEKWSSPADKIIGQLTEEVSTEWYKPLVELIFGTTSSSDIYNTLIADEIKEIIDRKAQDPQLTPQTLASNSVDKLLDVFELDKSDKNIAKIADKLANKLQTSFTDWQAELTNEINEFVIAQRTQALKGLAPLEKLGVKVKSLANQTDDAVAEQVKYAVSQYQTFKEKLINVLEKSANIQIGLSAALEQSASLKHTRSLTIEFLNTEHNLNIQLYRALILGRTRLFAQLLVQAQEQGSVFVPQESFSHLSAHEKTLSFNVDLAGFNISSVKNINSALELSVDNIGNIAVKGNVNANDTSNNFSETRTASMNLSYDLANAALEPSQFAAFACKYSNSDTKKHTVGEMKDILESLILPDDNIDIAEESLAQIIDANKIQSHLDWYQQQRSSQKFTTSTLDIFIGDTNKLIDTLLHTPTSEAFALAMDCILAAATSSVDSNRVMNLVTAYRDAIDKEMTLAESLNLMGDSTGMKEFKVRKTVEKSKRFGNDYKHCPEKMMKKIVRSADKVYDKANAMEELVHLLQTTLVCIEDLASADLSPEILQENLAAQLQSINKRLESSLAQWTNVSGFLMDCLDGGINKSLVCFLAILLTLAKNPSGFVRVLLTLTDKKDSKVIRVIA